MAPAQAARKVVLAGFLTGLLCSLVAAGIDKTTLRIAIALRPPSFGAVDGHLPYSTSCENTTGGYHLRRWSARCWIPRIFSASPFGPELMPLFPGRCFMGK